MSLPTLPPAPQGTTQDPDPWARLRLSQFKQGNRPKPTKYRISPEIRQMLTNSLLSAISNLCVIIKDGRIRPMTRCRAAIAILNRVYGESILPIDLLVDEDMRVDESNQ
jgi:hypothetical protein